MLRQIFSMPMDSKKTSTVFDFFRELAQERNQTIMAVTHDDEFAANSDLVLELSDGRLL